MQIIHDPAKLNSQTDKLSRLQTARSLNSGIQRLTAQIFLDEIIIIFVNFQIVDDRDSRMAQPLQKRCFLNETALCPPDTLNLSLHQAPDAWLKKQFRSDRVRSHVPAGIFQIERLLPYRASFRSIPPLKIHCIRSPRFPQPFLERFYAFFSYSNCQVIILYSMMNTKVPKSKT